MSAMIKICGVKTRTAIEAAATAGATHIGFNFVPSSPRFVTPDEAADLSRSAPDRLIRVAVTADFTDDMLAALIRDVRPSAFQLHGQEDTQRVAHVAARFGLPVIRALGIASADDVRAARGFLTCADMLLFDAKPAKPGYTTPTGGHGKAFNWTLLKGLSFSKPWFLAGGLTPATVAAAIDAVRPTGVDVASGVETSRGVKDDILITQFCAASVRAYAAEAVA
jgi:phosphoribosylanthranilate isomerase